MNKEARVILMEHEFENMTKLDEWTVLGSSPKRPGFPVDSLQ